jgi:rhomboid family GlyGly-CTERM serine protease
VRRAAAALALGAGAVAAFLIPGAARWLEYDRAAIAGGEVWRLLTAHFAHWSAEHLAWDVIAFLVLGVMCEREGRARFLACVGGAALAVSLAVWWAMPELDRYRGLSGLDSALLVLLAVSLMRHGDTRRLLAGAWGLVAFLAKLVWEGATGGALFVHDPGLAAVPLAHLVGALVGFAAGVPSARLVRTGYALLTGIAALSTVGCASFAKEEALFHGAETPLMKAAAYGRIATIRRLLADAAMVDARNAAGMTALMMAAWSGKKEAVVVLLQAGANPNATDREGETALVQALWSRDLPTVRALIANGADVNSADRYGNTPLQLAAGGRDETATTATRMLLDAGADVTARRGDSDLTALHYAAWTGNGATVLTLLSAGARVNDADGSGWTPLTRAMLYGRPDVVEALLAGGADLNVRSPGGWTALKEAEYRGHREMAERLRRAGAIDFPDGSR